MADRVIERSRECPLHAEGPDIPQQMESALTCVVCCCSVINPVQFIDHLNSQSLVRCHHLSVLSQTVHLCVGLFVPYGNTPPALWSSRR